jgi:hypothetical protein
LNLIEKPGWRLQPPGRAESKHKDKIMKFILDSKVILKELKPDRTRHMLSGNG